VVGGVSRAALVKSQTILCSVSCPATRPAGMLIWLVS